MGVFTSSKPAIIVLSKDNDQSFKWVSDGWNSMDNKDNLSSKVMLDIANQCIDEGVDVPDVVRRLEEAGFKVMRGV